MPGAVCFLLALIATPPAGAQDPAPWAEGPPALATLTLAQDPADSLYRQAREALNRGDYRRAVELFGQIRGRYPRSAHTPDAYYWEAFAQQRRGTPESLRAALSLLQQQAERHPTAATQGEARTLAVRIEGELARLGDASSAAALAERATALAASTERPTPASPGTRPTGRCSGENEEQTMVLNALLNMSAERAQPLLERVMARRDAESVCLRRRAIFLVAQKQTPRTEEMLLEAARSDPDGEVREQAIFWLAQTGSTRAAGALDSILRHSTDRAIQKRAIFALSQMGVAPAGATLRAYAGRADADRELRDQAIFWLGQSGNSENTEFLQGLYTRERDPRIKERILFAVSNAGSHGPWLITIATDTREPMALRKSAIFWAGQSATPLAELTQLYDRVAEVEMKEHLIFVLSQRNESAATDKLIAIARNDGNSHLRSRALFWLTQRNDPRVEQLLMEILERRPGGQ